MKFTFRLFVLFGLIVVGCDTSQKTTEEKPEVVSLYSYDIREIVNKAKDCNVPECTQVTINYPSFTEGQEIHNVLNKVIEQEVRKTISDYLMEEPSPSASFDQLTFSFLKSYETFKKEFPESTTPWDLTIDVVVSYTGKSFISLSVNASSYTGGAHPNNNVDYLNISKSGNKLTSLSSFFSDVHKLKVRAEQKFRSQYNLAPEDDLSEAGFMFDNDQFELSDNFGFSKSGVVFYYNSYEIASYAQGPTALLIPFEEIGDIYTPDP